MGIKAAGLIPLAHKSAGPLLDIVIPFENESTGYLAADPSEYVDCLNQIFDLSVNETLKMRNNARKSALERFSEQRFQSQVLSISLPQPLE